MYYPMVGTVYESLFTTSFINPTPKFVGLETYRRILADPGFRQVVLNSLAWTAGVVILQNVVGFLAALLLDQNLPGQGLMRSLVLLPWVLPGVVAAILWRFLYDPQLGLINSFLIGWGLSDQGVEWLADTATAMPAAILAAVWKGFPFSTVVYLAALQNVDREQIEAAVIDGAGPVRRLLDVVIPAVRPVIAVNLLLTTILTFNYFDMIWVLTRGGPLNSTHIFPTKIYELGFGQFRFGDAAAYGVISMLVLVVFIALYLLVQRRARA
jgi:multiple sugar transport system permease protein